MLSSPDFLADDSQVLDGSFQGLQTPEGDLHLRFSLSSGTELALPAVGVREVIATPPDRITPVPNTSATLLGVLNLRGQVIWVADAGQFLGEEVPINADRPEISIIAIEDEELVVGLAVDQVKCMEWLNPEAIVPPSNISDSMIPFIRGEWIMNAASSQSLKLLDAVAVIRSARWGG